MSDYIDQAKILVQSEDGRKGLVVGNRVISPHQFDPSIPDFSSRHYIFLNAYRYGTPLDEAAQKADLSVEQADRFLDRDDVKRWLADRAKKDHIKREWEEPGKWYQIGNDKLEGKREMDKADVVIWQEFGKRVVPTRGESAGNVTKIEINIDPNSVQNALDRQKAIDAELA